MTSARNELFDVHTPGVYHCYTRCVRRAFLCGFDKLTGKNYDYRKQWVKDRARFLAGIFFIDVYALAVMGNHSHVVLANRPEQMDSASDEEIARRWLTLFPKPCSKGVPQKQDVEELLLDEDRISQLRERLGNISWFMRCLNERIARRANREDKVTGRFFEGRFKCTALDDEAAILTCMIYVDLNEVRAKVAPSPEESKFTSAYDRIMARDSITGAEQQGYLAPIEADETKGDGGIFSSITLDEYLLVLDHTGRQQAQGKAGVIPKDLAPILVRLGIQPDGFCEITSNFDKYFFRLAGKCSSMQEAARKKGKAWFVGVSSARAFFV